MADRLALLVDRTNPAARQAADDLCAVHAFVPEHDASVGVVLGGDGFMLRTLHRLMEEGLTLPVYGLNLGTVGFLLNRLNLHGLIDRVAAAEPTVLHPLRMEALGPDGSASRFLAVNEVSLLRASAQSAHVRFAIDDGDIEVEDLHGDGVLVATAAGSTAYNRSAGGPIIPLSANLIALTPLAGFHPRNWRGALLDAATTVQIEALDPVKRPVHAAADHHEVGLVTSVRIRQATNLELTLLFDPQHTLESRILREQFR